MGKSFNNYMCKKDFHPSSRDNIKRVWMRQQQLEHEKEKQTEMMELYKKEQDMYETRVLMGDNKAKLGLSFMYDAPPGMEKKKDEDDEMGSQEYKFEWQRNAPREKWMKEDKETLNDQPFGVCVRNVRCIKCHQWGHINTDRECPLFNKTSSFDPSMPMNNHSGLNNDMASSSGLKLKPNILQRQFQGKDDNHTMIKNNEEEPEVAFLKNLTDKQKAKLLRRLNRMEKEEDGKKKKSKKSKKKKKKVASSSSESESSEDERRKKKQKKNKKKRKQSSSEGESNLSEDESKKVTKKRERKRSPSPDVRNKRREKNNSRSEEVRVKRERNHSSSPDVRDKRRERNHSSSPDVQNNRRERNRSLSPDVRNIRRERNYSLAEEVRIKRERNRSSSPDVQNKRRERNRSSSPDVKNKRRERKRSSSPDVRSKRRERKRSSSPDVRSKRRERKRSSSPDVRRSQKVSSNHRSRSPVHNKSKVRRHR